MAAPILDNNLHNISHSAPVNKPTIDTNKSKLNHIFRDSPGHFRHDTPQNRAEINQTVNPSNYYGKDGHGNDMYLRDLPNGQQTWALARNGKIYNAGINDIPLRPSKDPVTGITRLISNPHKIQVRKTQEADTLSFDINNIKGTFSKILDNEARQFKETLQQNGLTDSYNSSHPENPVPKQGQQGEIGGVANLVGKIEGLFDSYNALEEKTHHFFIPCKEGLLSFDKNLIMQMLGELIVGIYIHKTFPFFSLHFNKDSHLYPVLHPAYQNTYVGYVVAYLDYLMKGFLNGGYYNVDAVLKWQKGEISDTELQQHWISLHDRFKEVTGKVNTYFTFNEILSGYVEKSKKKHAQELLQESPVLSDHTHIRSSFRIIAKQNNIYKTENVFTLDGGFDVFYTMEPDPIYAEELRLHRLKYGKDPINYTNLVKAHVAMCSQIKTTMPLLPEFKELFQALNTINFFCYYFNTLKNAQKIAIVTNNAPTVFTPTPTLFPHLPIRTIQRVDLRIDLKELYLKLRPTDQPMLSQFIANKQIRTPNNAQSICQLLLPAFKELVQARVPQYTYTDATTKLLNDWIAGLDTEIAGAELIASSSLTAPYNIKTVLEVLEKTIGALKEKLKGAEKAKIKPVGEDESIAKITHKLAVKKSEYELLKQLEKVDKSKGHRGQINAMDYLVFAVELGFHTVKTYEQLTAEERNFHRRVVGGCGMQLDAQPMSYLVSAETVVPEAQNLSIHENEQIISFPSGALFSLNLINYHPLESHDNDWLQALSSKQANKTQNMFTAEEEGYTLLHQAVKDNLNFDGLSKIIASDPGILNQAAHDGVTPLYYAVQLGYANVVKHLLMHSPDVNCRTHTSMTPLHRAVINENAVIVSLLLGQQGLDANAELEDKTTPLIAAVETGNCEIVQCLIKSGRVINSSRQDGFAPIHIAAKNDDLSMCTSLLSSGISKVNETMPSKKTALHLAAAYGSPELVKYLLSNRADATIVGHDMETPFMTAIQAGNTLAAELIFNDQGKSEVYSGDNEIHRVMDCATVKGDKPWLVALQGRFYALFDLMVQKRNNADEEIRENVKLPHPYIVVMAMCRYKVLPQRILSYIQANSLSVDHIQSLYYEACKVGHPGLAGLLRIKYKVQSFKDDRNWTPLHFAARDNQKDVILAAIKRKDPQLFEATSQGVTPISLAARNGSDIVLELLLNHYQEKNINLELLYGEHHLLYAAVEGGHQACTETILKRVNHPNIPLDRFKTYAVHIAAKRNDKAMCAMLRNRGADFSVTNDLQQTAFTIAYDNNSTDVIEFLLAAENEIEIPPGTLHFAAGKASTKQLKTLLLKTGLLANGESPLFEALRKGRLDNFILLVNSGCDIKATNAEKKNLLDIAIALKNKEFEEYLLQIGLKPTFKPVQKTESIELKMAKTGFQQALATQNKAALLNFAEKLPKDISLEWNLQDGLVVHLPIPHYIHNYAPKASEDKLLKAYLKRFENHRTVRDNEGKSVFHLLAKLGKVPSKVEDLELADKKGTTPLHLLAKTSKNKGLIAALNLNPKLDIEDENGFTPLFYAVAKHNTRNVVALLKAGANINHNAKEQATVMSLALADKALGMVKLLAEHGYEINWPLFKDSRTALHYSIENRLFDISSVLIFNGGNVNQPDAKGICPIHLAAESGNIPLARLLLSVGASLHALTNDKQTVAHYAAQSDNPRMITFLDHQGVSFNASNSIGETPLHLASKKSRAKTISILVSTGSNVEAISQIAGLLFYAALSGNLERAKSYSRLKLSRELMQRTRAITAATMRDDSKMVSYFFAENAENKIAKLPYNIELDELNNQCLHLAARYGSVNVLEQMIRNGCSLAIYNSNGQTPLHLAVQHNRLAAAQVLLETFDLSLINIPDAKGNTYLHYACTEGNREMSALLIRYGASVHMPNAQGLTPLHISAKKEILPLIHLLLACGAHPLSKTPEGVSATNLLSDRNKAAKDLMLKYRLAAEEREKNQESLLHTAVRMEDTEHFSLIAQLDGLDHQNKDGQSALHLAFKNLLHWACVKLIDKGADYHLKDNDEKAPYELRNKENGNTAMHEVAKLGNVRFAQFLVLLGTTLEEKNAKKGTPLHLAAAYHQDNMIRFLLKLGANPVVTNESEWTPLSLYLQKEPNPEIVNLFLEAEGENSIPFFHHQVKIAIERENYNILDRILKIRGVNPLRDYCINVSKNALPLLAKLYLHAKKNNAPYLAVLSEFPRILNYKVGL